MLRRMKDIWSRDMIRPLIYKIFTRGILALLVAQLAHFYAPENWPLHSFANLSLALAVIFLLGTLLAWLRLDGLNIPQLKLPRRKKIDPPSPYGDMADHLDDDIVSFEELDQEEQAACVLLADACLTLVCLFLILFRT